MREKGLAHVLTLTNYSMSLDWQTLIALLVILHRRLRVDSNGSTSEGYSLFKVNVLLFSRVFLQNGCQDTTALNHVALQLKHKYTKGTSLKVKR